MIGPPPAIHLRRILDKARTIYALAAGTQQPGMPSEPQRTQKT